MMQSTALTPRPPTAYRIGAEHHEAGWALPWRLVVGYCPTAG